MVRAYNTFYQVSLMDNATNKQQFQNVTHQYTVERQQRIHMYSGDVINVATCYQCLTHLTVQPLLLHNAHLKNPPAQYNLQFKSVKHNP